MKELTCVVVGGGFAGIHAVKAILKAFEGHKAGRPLRLILIDKQPYHLRKVLLFRPAAGAGDITVPWQRILPEGSHFVQGTVLNVESRNKQLVYRDVEGNEQLVDYEVLVIAVGSVARQPETERGGIALTDPEAAKRIREQWLENIRLAALETTMEERRRLMTAAVAGAGITGIETAAELAYAMRAEAMTRGLDPAVVKVHLLNSRERLFLEGPAKVGRRLEQQLAECGVIVHHRRTAMREKGGRLLLSEGTPLPTGLTIWTLGLVPNPALRSMSLPLAEDGRILVDECYRVREATGVYSIGDCAYIVDPASGKVDRMTCKEAIPQAQRLGDIVSADIAGLPAPRHKGVIDSFTVGLGPNRGVMWTRKWGIDMIVTGKLAYKIKTFLWDYASMLRG